MTSVSDAPVRESIAPGPRRSASWPRIAGGTIVALGIGLFFYTRSDMWLDEALTVNVSRLPLDQLRDALERDGAPPLYYALLHVWTGVFGDGDLAARSLSGLFAVGALVAGWFAGRRWFDTTTAWLTVVVMAVNPYMIRYATEARMYSLQILLVACGLVLVPRACERPSFGRLGSVALVTALLVYTHYWSFSLVGVTLGAVLFVSWRRTRAPAPVVAGRRVDRRRTARVPAVVADVPLPTRAHRDPVGRRHPSRHPDRQHVARLLGWGGAGGLGARVRGWSHSSSSACSRVRWTSDGSKSTSARNRRARALAAVGGATLVIGTSLGYLGGQAFQSRYSAVVFPFFALLLARGLAVLTDTKVRIGALALVVGLGFVGGVRNAVEQRTQAGEVASVLVADAAPGDLIVYCPDQLGPSVHRLLPADFDETTYPAFAPPTFVNWVDYQDRIEATDSGEFANAVVERAGDHTIWLVTGPAYPNLEGRCAEVSGALAASRPLSQRVTSDEARFELTGLQEFAPSNR